MPNERNAVDSDTTVSENYPACIAGENDSLSATPTKFNVQKERNK